MTEHDKLVHRQKILLEAEEWSKGVRSIHVHSLKTMWYDDRPADTDKGNVIDTEYNSGIITREQKGKLIHTFGKELKGEALVSAYERAGAYLYA